eukprot:TRINITY_DN231_c0_g1_i2.p1 TRINITY_DN231_c0_g1~~TRINITY_DN231_c0_g1_i2.p1  ORF type:complete len:197 (-),score=36.63 TRINITY_DN231_c0_g1_i2:112-702(-)
MFCASSMIFTLTLGAITYFSASTLDCFCQLRPECQIINDSSQLISTRVSSLRSKEKVTTYKAEVLQVYKGNLTVGQNITFYSQTKCIKLKDKEYLLSLLWENENLMVENCGFHVLNSKQSKSLENSLENFSNSCCGDVKCPEIECEGGTKIDPRVCCPRCRRSCSDDAGEHVSGSQWTLPSGGVCHCDDSEMFCIL